MAASALDLPVGRRRDASAAVGKLAPEVFFWRSTMTTCESLSLESVSAHELSALNGGIGPAFAVGYAMGLTAGAAVILLGYGLYKWLGY